MNSLSARLGPDFGPFLYASVGHEANGMTLSVLSTLARHDLDPWLEAAELAALPVDDAATRLASMIAGLPGTAGRVQAGGAANRLVLLLPKRANSTTPRSETVVDHALGMKLSSLVIWLLAWGLIMGTQAIQTSLNAPTHTKQAAATAATEGSPVKGPPLGSGQ